MEANVARALGQRLLGPPMTVRVSLLMAMSPSASRPVSAAKHSHLQLARKRLEEAILAEDGALACEMTTNPSCFRCGRLEGA